jgi:hypothetical protein
MAIAIIREEDARIRDDFGGEMLISYLSDTDEFSFHMEGPEVDDDFPEFFLTNEVAEALHEVLGVLLERGRL